MTAAASWPFAVILALAVLAYANALNNPFVFDDRATILENPTLKTLVGSLAGGPRQGPTAGRPLVNLTFALNYGWSGASPWGYHATNVLLLGLCGCVLFALIRRALMLPRLSHVAAGRETAIAAAVAAIWTVHPIQSELVDYVTQRTESMMALAWLITLYAGVRGMTTDRALPWYALSALASAAGMACKESMVTAPIVVLLFDATFVSGGPMKALRARPAYYGALAATWLVLIGLNLSGPRSNSAGFTSGPSAWTYLLNQAPMILRYLRVALAPVGLVLDYGEPRALSLANVWPSFLVVAGLVLASLAAWARWPAVAFLGTTFFVLLAPTSSFVPIATEVGAERRMFLPLAALIILGVFAVRWVLHHLPAGRRSLVAPALAVLAVVVLGAATLQRNTEYATSLGIWQTVIDRWPTGRAYYNVGIELNELGRRSEAIAAYERALADWPDAHYALGFERQADGRLDEAIAHYREYIRLEPEDANVLRAYHQLGRALLSQGKLDEALTAFREVLARHSGDLDATGGVAATLLEQEKFAEAADAYRAYLQLAPGNQNARFNLGLALFKASNYADAATAFSEVIAIDPSNVGAIVNLGRALGSMGRVPEAIRTLQRAAELEPDPQTREELRAMVKQLEGR